MSDRSGLTRRGLIGGGAAALGGAAVAAPGSATASPDLAAEYPVVPEHDVRLAAHGRSVLIVGGGLSGLMAACELLDRGFDVTVLEKNPSLGGRLRAWRDPEFGAPLDDPDWPGYPIEHGTHIVLNFYNNFREFLGRHGLRVRQRPVNGPGPAISFAYPDGTVDDREPAALPAPLHGSTLLQNLKLLSDEENARMGWRQGLKMMAFDAADPDEVAYLDGMTLADWVAGAGFPEGLTPAVLDPVMDMANFHPAERTSALYLHRFIGAMLGERRDMSFVQFFQDSTQETIIEPMAAYVRARGGRIVMNAEVDDVRVEGRRVTGVRTRAVPAGRYVCPICGEVHETEPSRCRRCGWAGGGFRAEPLPVRDWHADEVLLAVDIPGAQALFRQAPFAGHPFFDPVQELPTSSIVVVYLWYPHAVGAGRWADHFGPRECLMTGGFPFLGTTLNLSVLKAPSFGACGADVIETQIARVDRVAGMSDAEIAARIDADLRALIPELPAVADHRIMRWDNFSTMTVGAEAHRPSQQTPFENFWILGDYTALEHNCILMEKVTVNVRRAVNRLLERAGVDGGRMRILPSETPNPWLRAARKLLSVEV